LDFYQRKPAVSLRRITLLSGSAASRGQEAIRLGCCTRSTKPARRNRRLPGRRQPGRYVLTRPLVVGHGHLEGSTIPFQRWNVGSSARCSRDCDTPTGGSERLWRARYSRPGGRRRDTRCAPTRASGHPTGSASLWSHSAGGGRPTGRRVHAMLLLVGRSGLQLWAGYRAILAESVRQKARPVEPLLNVPAVPGSGPLSIRASRSAPLRSSLRPEARSKGILPLPQRRFVLAGRYSARLCSGRRPCW